MLFDSIKCSFYKLEFECVYRLLLLSFWISKSLRVCKL